MPSGSTEDLEQLPVSPAIRYPGFEGLRLLAASSVIFSHAFIIAEGSDLKNPIVRSLATAGDYGVYTFFIISGFLLAQSLSHDGSAIRFAINRVLRIYPGFIFCILVTALVIGPIGTSLSLREYFSSADFLSYVRISITCLCDQRLPGVFAYPGPNYPSVVNGSLWSLCLEVLSYLTLAWFWLAFRNIKAVSVVLTLLAIGTLFSPAVSHIISGIAYTLPFFVGGVLTYSICQYVGLKWEVAAVSAALLLILMIFGSSQYVFSIFGAYLIVLVGSRPNIGSKFAERFGDISYGMYLFGWPLEQLVKQYTQTNNAWVLMLITFPLAAGIAGISYHAVEKPALRLKKPLSLLADSFLRSSGMAQHRLIGISATLAFLASGAVILTDGDRWWFVTPSLANVALSSLAGATITWLIVKLYRQFLSPT